MEFFREEDDMFPNGDTTNERKKKAYWRSYDSKVQEDVLAKDRVYVPVETFFTSAIADAIADYSLCNQWD